MKPILIMCCCVGLLAACSGSDESTSNPSNVTQSAAAVDTHSAVLAATEAGAPTSTAQADSSQPTESALAVQRPQANPNVKDPGPRASPMGAGAELPLLNAAEHAAFQIGQADFSDTENTVDGLGPTLNMDSCSGCHSQPAVGGSSPPVNPQVAFATKMGALNKVPSFLTTDGPVREARFVRNADGSPDGGVHALFTIAGRSDALDCKVAQPDFATALSKRNVTYRIPTPVFGAGLIEAIPDRTILANMANNAPAKRNVGIRGRGNVVLPFAAISAQPNKNGNDGTLGRFGWKAQNKSLLVFSGEAYNVEMGISNELFPTERDETEACQYATIPNSISTLTMDPVAPQMQSFSSIEKFSFFMRLLAPPTPSNDTPGGGVSVSHGKELFSSVGCALCHSPTMKTGNSPIVALRYQDVNLYSDLLLHDMGTGLADGISQGQAGPREFRTAPLWGLGQRLYFLHDGRAADLKTAVLAHVSEGSEANGVIAQLRKLTDHDQQDLMNFLRSL
jgi:CxxC motif-containing protein (DUF1111 family)